MKYLYAIVPVALLALAGCATDGNTQYAKTDCKVAPLETANIGKPRETSTLAQRQAEMDLASSGYRMRNLNRPGMNTVEDALRDCY
jgi:hypothetical protein